MNQYGQEAKRATQEADPARIAAMTPQEVEDYFTDLGQRAETRILDLTDSLIAQRPNLEDYLAEVGRRNQCRAQATEMVMNELVYAHLQEVCEAKAEADDLWDQTQWMTPQEERHHMWRRWWALVRWIDMTFLGTEATAETNFVDELLTLTNDAQDEHYLHLWKDLLNQEARFFYLSEEEQAKAPMTRDELCEAAITLGLANPPQVESLPTISG